MFDTVGHFIGTVGFVLFALAALVIVINLVTTKPNVVITVVVLSVIFAVVVSSHDAQQTAALTAGVALYAVGGLVASIAAFAVTPVFWLIVIAIVIAQK